MAPDIFGEIKNTGMVGQGIGYLGDKSIGKPLHNVSFGTVGIFYKKGRDNPIVGCILYFLVYMLMASFLATIVGLLVR